MQPIHDENLEEQKYNEENTKRQYITPILEERWGKDSNSIVMEYYFTDGRINVNNDSVSRGKPKKVDYLLLIKNNLPLAIVEAKGLLHDAMEGYQQAINYAQILDVPFAYSTNGKQLIEEDLITGVNDSNLSMSDFPSSDDLWDRYIKETGINEQGLRLINQPYYEDVVSEHPKKPRYYQRIAINRTIKAIAEGKQRILLLMATGTGKTYTAFQIVWRLWKSRTKKKILYLVDRNVLADQTMEKDFKPLVQKGVMTKIKNDRIKVDTAYEVYTCLYHQLKLGEKDYYKDFPADFFDLIIIDECHRGSASEESSWHEILEYFHSATQIGLTATPKETKDVSNIEYFGKPIYTYTLKQGIEDGYLAPYRVISVKLDVDVKGYRPEIGELDIHGKPLEDRLYTMKEFDRLLVVEKRRDAVAQKITDYLKNSGDRYQKTIVFCENIEHANAMVLRLKNLNSDLVAEDSRYIMKITGDDEIGKAQLDNFTDPNSKYPVIAVTSKLMSTGVDSETCKLIVLDKSIGSLTEFKQTIGRGTRVKEKYYIDDEEQSKMFFTILDFRENYKQFEDPDFDGEPVSIIDGKDNTNSNPPGGSTGPGPGPEPKPKSSKLFVDGKEATVEDEIVSYLDENGRLVKMNLDSCIKNNIIGQYPSIYDLSIAFSKAVSKTEFLDDLMLDKEYFKKLEKEFCYNIDKVDLVLYIGYQIIPISKEERLRKYLESEHFNNLSQEQKEVLQVVLDRYKTEDFESLFNINVLKTKQLENKGYSLQKILKVIFKSKAEYIKKMKEIEMIIRAI